MKPKVFIGSSTEGLEVARGIELQLEHDAEVTVWKDGVFGLGRGTLESLVLALDEFDFAILVLTADDMIISRDEKIQSPRDNILLELGMFIGRLGRERTFIVFNRDKDLKLPSDLAGVTMADYGDRQDGNLVASLGPPSTKIRYAIRSHGTFPKNTPDAVPYQKANRPFVTAKVTTHAEGNTASALNITVHNSGTSPAKDIRLNVKDAELKAAFSNESSDPLKKSIINCFSEKGMIPVLENGQSVTNSFGMFHINQKQSTWKNDFILNIEISYLDLDGNEYNHKIPLKLASDIGFAGSRWGE
uniref:Nucleotide-binding protein n=1 Tax=Candidatus Desulfatibia profunda TaxID=2841695 RepID=A0A8J6THB0_9BACT|nr:nucleotide-binding protein [Candidatus Desulfatibia profunda]